ncbi:hypothetical protein EON64_00720 [archaeon]|nr:MAG: hypothetical protein EON64_00720 [archaeon]
MTSYTLGTAQVYQAAAVFTAILTVISVVSVRVFQKDVKRLAWTISVINSGLMTLAGMYYLYFIISSDLDFFVMSPKNLQYFEGRTDFSVLVSLWFAIANIFDLAVGMVYYPKYLGLLTAYVHHSVFIWMMYASTTGDGIFTTLRPFSLSFCNCLIEELPTFLLALGSMYAPLRTDLGFGVSFFVLRIVYHAYFFVYAIKMGVQFTVLVLYTLTLTMHLNWFYAWVTKYGSKMVKVKPEDQKKSI